MEFSQNTKQFLMIVAITAIAAYFVIPKSGKGVKAPKEADKKKIDDLHNAEVCLNAYLNAKEDGRSQTDLNKLNSMFAQEYGIRVYLNKQKKYVARTLDGKDILMVK